MKDLNFHILRWLALLAIMLQALLGTAHLGAMAAAGAGARGADGLSGILQLCTPAGLVEIDIGTGNKTPQRSLSDNCSVCSVSAVSDFTASGILHVVAPVVFKTVKQTSPHFNEAISLSSLRNGHSRAPPA